MDILPYANTICTLGAARTYFKSKKSDLKREQSGIKARTSASARKRQRRHNVRLPLAL